MAWQAVIEVEDWQSALEVLLDVMHAHAMRADSIHLLNALDRERIRLTSYVDLPVAGTAGGVRYGIRPAEELEPPW